MPAHLAACVVKHDVGDGAAAECIHRRIDGRGPFWLDVELRADARLEQLDDFLRRTWLECCGHLSAFYMDDGRSEYPKGARAMGVFGSPGTVVRYEYDYASTTRLRLQSVGKRVGRGDKGVRVRLLARNEPPPFICGECGQPATEICPFWEGDNPFVCDAHSRDHACEDADCHLPAVNSPRVGVCGYTG